MTCPVANNCRDTTQCPFCVEGSEYRPIDRRVLFPAVIARQEAKQTARRAHKESEAYRTGKRAHRKGRELERELARLVGGYVVPGSGALDGRPNDVVARNGWRLECKGRADGFGLIFRWLGTADVVAMREPGGEGPWLFACRLDWMTLRLEDVQPTGDGAGVLGAVAAVSGSLGVTSLPGQVGCTVHRRTSLVQVRRWIEAERADVLCPHRDLEGFAAVMDAEHLGALLAARELRVV